VSGVHFCYGGEEGCGGVAGRCFGEGCGESCESAGPEGGEGRRGPGCVGCECIHCFVGGVGTSDCW
jgi:hypothetical protein